MTAPKKPPLPLLGPDPNVPRDVHLVGRYAIGIDWQDSHSSIYPFDFLRGACPCPACAAHPPAVGYAPAAPPAAPDQTWPIEIKKEGTGLRVRWQDGHQSIFEGRELRQLCRCASCTEAERNR